MLDSDLSPDFQHRTRKVTKKQAKRDRFFVPILLFLMVIVGIGIGWAAFEISEDNLDSEAIVRLLKRKYNELQQGPALITVDQPEGEANPEALATVQAFVERQKSLKKPVVYRHNPIQTGLKKIFYQSGEDPDLIPKTLEREIKETIERLKKETPYQAIYRAQVKYRAQLQPILDEQHIPPFMLSIPWVESQSSAQYEDIRNQKAGLWALRDDVARKHGLDLSLKPDPRFDPEASTRAARSYLVELFHRAGGQSWILAAAAYRAGPGFLDELMQRRETWRPKELQFMHWHGANMVPKQPKRYVLEVLATAVMYSEAVDFNLKTVE